MQNEILSLRAQLQSEQQQKIETFKNTMVLEARLKSAEEEANRAERERYNLETELQHLKGTQAQLMNKIQESQEFMKIMSQFLQKNGLMVNTSFIGEDDELDIF